MSDERQPGASSLPPAIVHPGVPRPPAPRFAGLGSRATMAIIGAALILGVGAWFATRDGGAADEGLGLGGLGRKRDDIDHVLRQMDRLANELCACTDTRCADAVMKRMSSLKEPASKPSSAQMDRAMASAERMAACQKKLVEVEMRSSGGTAAP
jgi:hypothetical protein